MVMIYDTVRPRGMRRTDDGYLVGRARVARTGIQLYLGDELGRPDMPVVRVYRPESAVFDRESLRTYAGKPMTDDHPPGGVNADTWKDKAIGTVGSQIMRDGEFVSVDLAIMDKSAIEKIDAGKAELSAGYSASLVWEAGINDAGEAYDARIENLRINHVAVVDAARGGSSLRLGDSRNPEPFPIAQDTKETNEMITIEIDGVPVQVADAAAAATIKKALAERETSLADAQAKLKTATDTYEGTLAAKEKALTDAKAELQTVKASVLSDAQIEARARERAELIDTAKKLHDADYTGKSAEEIRAAVVAAKLGDAAVAGKSAEYIAAAFDVMKASGGGQTRDRVREAINANDGKPTAPAVNYGDVLEPTPAQAQYRQRLADAWRETVPAK